MDLGEFMTFDFIMYMRYMCTYAHIYIYICALLCIARLYYNTRVCVYKNEPSAGRARLPVIWNRRRPLDINVLSGLHAIIYGIPVNWTTPHPTPQIKYTAYVIICMLCSTRFAWCSAPETEFKPSLTPSTFDVTRGWKN